MISAAATGRRPLDYSALEARPCSPELRGLRLDREDRRGLRAEVASAVTGLVSWGLVGVVLLALMALLVLAAVGLRPWVPALLDARGATLLVFALSFFLASAIGLVLVARRYRAELPVLLAPIRRRRLRLFARANPGVDYRARIPEPDWAASLFRYGISGVATDVVTVGGRHRVTLGNYRFTGTRMQDRVGTGRAFARFDLPARVPNMTLVARRDRRRSAFPASFRRDQELRLEGDFDRRFTLYAPRAYERDALYVFTPDLMALVLDRLGDVDVEVIDSSVFVCFRRPIRIDSQRTFDDVLQVVDALAPKFDRQTRHYRDDRSHTPGVVAPSGARLRLRIPAFVVGMSIVILAITVLRILQLAGVMH